MKLYDAPIQMTKNLTPGHDVQVKLFLEKVYKYSGRP
jgi:hypothetical protein